ncbi:MAG: TetR-like C-terminal domain-containing protein [Polyangiales bacterium]
MADARVPGGGGHLPRAGAPHRAARGGHARGRPARGALGRGAILLSSTAGRATLSVALSGGLGDEGDALRERLAQAAVASARAMFDAAVARGECAPVDAPEAVVFALVGAVLHRVLLERRAVSAAWVEATVHRALHGVIAAPRRVTAR